MVDQPGPTWQTVGGHKNGAMSSAAAKPNHHYSQTSTSGYTYPSNTKFTHTPNCGGLSKLGTCSPQCGYK